jgi:putative hemolysin
MTTAAFDSFIPELIPFRIPSRLERLLARAMGIDEIARVYQALATMGGERPIADRLLEFLSVACTVSQIDLAHVPASGAAIVTVNHPFGILDGAIMRSLLGRIRGDVRFLANRILGIIPELRGMTIPVDLQGGRNPRAARQALEHLRTGGMLVIFPAGEVSHFRWSDRAISDAAWNPMVARMAEIAGAPVVPAHIQGANGPLFQIAGMVHPALRTLLLGRELLNKRGRQIEVRVGPAVAPEKLAGMPTLRERADYLRWRTYLLAGRQAFKPRTAFPLRARTQASCEPVASAAAPPSAWAKEIAALPGECLLDRSGDLAVYLAPATHIPNVLNELGRLREITFRAAGEGTGKSLDLDEFDSHYLHLFVWHAKREELVGAYRLARTDAVRRQSGIGGLYTATLFRYEDRFLDRLGPALELGRSFVRQEYQKGFAPLLLLWKGIGAYIARNPQCRILFGPVSISNQYQAVSRELMISFLEKYAVLRDWTGLVRNRRAFRDRLLKGPHRPALPEAGFDIEDLSAIVSDIEQRQTGVPVLLRQYLRLGGKLLGFNVDPKFANALDGLILVDLTKTEPKLLERYLGKSEAAAFLEFQKGNYGTQ